MMKKLDKVSNVSSLAPLSTVITILEVDLKNDVVVIITSLVARRISITGVIVENYYYCY